ncbi:uncharacterized protein [Chelonus insularis]|uniref:uncharacterized protein n=1 Tax=Chelonus insularis TaxID=460826 RepID=UPI00158F3AD7|nr:uncharacterized protein LOC118067545 [Chelonus insularis]
MAKLICLLVLAFAACMVAGLSHQDVNTMLHRTARAANPNPQYGQDIVIPGPGHYSGYNHGGHGFGGHGFGGHGYPSRSQFQTHCPHGIRGPCHVDEVIHNHPTY